MPEVSDKAAGPWRAAFLRNLLTVTFVLLAAGYAWHERSALAELELPSLIAGSVVAVTFVFGVGMRSAYNWLVARRLGAGLSATESFMLSCVVTACNFVLPVGAGAGIRAMYMKRVHNFAFAHFAGGMLVFAAYNLLIVSLIALLVLGLRYRESIRLPWDLVAAFALVAICTLAVMQVARSAVAAESDAPNAWWSALRQGTGLLLSDNRFALQSTVIVLANLAAAVVAWAAALWDLMPGIRATDIALVASSQVISGFVTITPGGAGFQELAGIFVGRAIAESTLHLFAVLVWMRVVRIITIICFALPSAVILRSRHKLESAGKID